MIKIQRRYTVFRFSIHLVLRIDTKDIPKKYDSEILFIFKLLK